MKTTKLHPKVLDSIVYSKYSYNYLNLKPLDNTQTGGGNYYNKYKKYKLKYLNLKKLT